MPGAVENQLSGRQIVSSHERGCCYTGNQNGGRMANSHMLTRGKSERASEREREREGGRGREQDLAGVLHAAADEVVAD